MADLRTHALDPTPENYQLLYAVASAHLPALNEEVAQLTQNGRPLDSAAAASLRAKYLQSITSEDAMMAVGGKLEQELAGVVQMLDSASKDTGVYGASLDHVSDALTTDRSPTEVRALMETLVTATKQMQGRSKQLETRLQESKTEVMQLRSNMEEIRAESLTDQLTGIANRRCFGETLSACISATTGDGSALTLVLGDIDHFKGFNDRFGHHTGDQVLKLVAQCMRHHVSGDHIPARYGGEEFAFILPATDLTDGVDVADKVRRTIESKELVQKSTGETLGTVTMSFGAALYTPGESADAFIQRADACLYAAKHAGRNQVKWEAVDDVQALAS